MDCVPATTASDVRVKIKKLKVRFMHFYFLHVQNERDTYSVKKNKSGALNQVNKFNYIQLIFVIHWNTLCFIHPILCGY